MAERTLEHIGDDDGARMRLLEMRLEREQISYQVNRCTSTMFRQQHVEQRENLRSQTFLLNPDVYRITWSRNTPCSLKIRRFPLC